MNIVPTGIQNAISNPKVRTLVENTIFAVSAETGLKMIGRPTFIMMDKTADSEEKKRYAAVKEMFYQGTCLALYLSCVQPLKKVFYKGLSKVLSNNPKNAEKLKQFDELNSKLLDLKKTKGTGAEIIRSVEKQLKTDAKMHLGKGARELSAIFASITMLTMVAPQLSHAIIHPVMKMIGMEEKPKTQEKA